MIVCLDANCVIYFVEQNPIWGPKVTARLAAIKANGDMIAASDLARTECLAKPLHAGDAKLVADYHAFFNHPDIRMLALTSQACELAAAIRAASNFILKVPDCLHLATAIEHGCGVFLTNDAQLTRCTAITVEVIV